MTILITFFPITITVYDGLRSAKVEMEELLRTYGATQWQIYRKVKVPCALPYFFSAVKMAIPMSIIGAAIGEIAGGAERVGLLFPPDDDAAGRSRSVAPIVLLSVTAMMTVGLVSLLEKRLIRWRGES